MTSEISKSTLFALTAAAVLWSPCAALGAAKVEADKPKFDYLMSPEFSGGKSKPFKPKGWLEVETKLKVAVRPEPKSKTCDRLTVKWYVAVENPDKPTTYLKLTKEVEHVNIPLDEDVYVSIYLSPASIRRLTGFDRATKNAVKYVGFEVIIDGKVEASETDKGEPKWWTKPSDKISDSETVPLLSKAETPFAQMWWDRYAEVKSKTTP
ncbi:MAG: hypothetical protein NTW21_18330 [Verrucomicrobia bacterium]|nr:hypothetical protein [Verrucomicrobiota bacterium]